MIRLGARTGYDIKRRVEASTRFFWSASPGQIYPELKRLEADELVSRTEDPRGDRPRSVYSLTAAGEAALHEWLIDPEHAFELRNEGLLKLFFADALSAEEAIGVVRAMREAHEAKLAAIRRVGLVYRPEYRFAYITWRYGVGIQAWIVQWRAGAHGPARKPQLVGARIPAPASPENRAERKRRRGLSSRASSVAQRRRFSMSAM